MQAQWEEKIWGKVSHIESPDAMTSILVVKPGFRCSIHRHAHRHNAFMCLTGLIRIDFYGTGVVPDLTVKSWEAVSPEKCLVVSAGVWHSFTVFRPGFVMEGYWTTDGTPVDPNDIERYDEGRAVNE